MDKAIEMVNVSLETRSNTLLKNISFDLQKERYVESMAAMVQVKACLLKQFADLFPRHKGKYKYGEKQSGFVERLRLILEFLLKVPAFCQIILLLKTCFIYHA